MIPAYNAEPFLGDAIESVLSQTRPPDEFFVIDDGSTDGTVAVARRYPAVTLITQPNRGPAAARNRGIAESEGELISFHDADDLMHPTKLAMQAAALEQNPGLGCVMTRQEVLLEEGAELPFWSPDSEVPVARIAVDLWNNSNDMP